MPAIMASLSRLLPLTWHQAFSLTRLASIFLAYLIFFYYLRTFFDDRVSLIGLLFLVATVPLTFSNWHEFPTDFPELITFTLAFWLIHSERYVALAWVTFIATWNRETTFFIPLLVAASLFDLRKPTTTLKFTTLVGLAWLLPYSWLRSWTGMPVEGAYGLTLDHNLRGLATLIERPSPYNQNLFYLWLLGPLWILPFRSWTTLPRTLRRGLLVLPAFLYVYVFAGGYLNEARPLMPLYALMIPASLWRLFPPPNASPVPEAVIDTEFVSLK